MIQMIKDYLVKIVKYNIATSDGSWIVIEGDSLNKCKLQYVQYIAHTSVGTCWQINRRKDYIKKITSYDLFIK